MQSCSRLDNFEEDYFDVVFASNLLEHLTQEDMEGTLEGAKRILRPRGRFIVLQPNFRYAYKQYFDDYTHLQIFTHVGLCDLLKAHGFSILEVRPKFLPFSVKSNFPVIPLLIRLYLNFPAKPFAGQMLVVAENGPL